MCLEDWLLKLFRRPLAPPHRGRGGGVGTPNGTVLPNRAAAGGSQTRGLSSVHRGANVETRCAEGHGAAEEGGSFGDSGACGGGWCGGTDGGGVDGRWEVTVAEGGGRFVLVPADEFAEMLEDLATSRRALEQLQLVLLAGQTTRPLEPVTVSLRSL